MEQLLTEAPRLKRGGASLTEHTNSTRRSRHLLDTEGPLPPSSAPNLPPPRKLPRTEQDVGVAKKEASGGRRVRRTVRERSQHEGTTAAQAKAIYEVYTPIDMWTGVDKDTPITPIV